MHGAKYRHAAEHAHLLVCISDYTARDAQELLGVEPERTPVVRPAPADVFRADGERADLGRPYVLTVATLEPRKNLETLLAAHELLGEGPALAVVGAEGWGPQPALDRPGVIRLGYVDDAELARLYRGAAVFASLALRGLRDPDRRGDGERRSGRRVVASVARRGLRRRRAPRRSRPARGVGRCDRGGVSSPRRARRQGPRARGVVLVARVRRSVAHRLRERPCEDLGVRVGIDVSPLRQTRAGTARYLLGCSRTSSGSSPSSVSRTAARARRRRSRAMRGGIPSRCRGARGLDVLHCPSFRGPVRSRTPLVVTVHDLAVLRHPEDVQPLDAHVLARLRSARCARS